MPILGSLKVSRNILLCANIDQPLTVKPSTVAQNVRDHVEAIKKKAAMRAAAAEESESDEDNKVLAPGALDYSNDDDLPEAHTLGQKERAAAIEAKDLFSEVSNRTFTRQLLHNVLPGRRRHRTSR